MTAALPDFSITISQKRWACVLDPTVAFSAFGLPLVTRLGTVMEVWVARELWHILDNTHFYLQHPDTLMSAADTDNPSFAWDLQAVIHALRGWERIRLENDPAHQHCYWIGDGPVESFLPDGQEPEIVWHYEALSAALDHRLPGDGPLPVAYRDTASLAITLPAAFILTHLPPQPAANEFPPICQALDTWKIPCRQVSADDPWHAKEGEILRQILVQAGLSKWVWAGFRPAVLHLTAPAALAVETGRFDGVDFIDDNLAETGERVERSIDYWRGAKGFWYLL
jgi:hypothetical protein